MGMSRVVPALPVRHIETAIAVYTHSFGFTAQYSDPTFAKLTRDDVEIHLWAADDDSWKDRPEPAPWPVRSGAESFLAGTASCRITVDDVAELYDELSRAGVLHPADAGHPGATDWGTTEFATVDGDGNLITFSTNDIRTADTPGAGDGDAVATP
ncbi:VOC family protein [Rhodococcus sp. NBC_00297]|uniref:VOC family protein n=1 Tax=Rhodococcus sp. NBC_00297 TaxID=2976005 RepID=UPI002E2939E0|nr:VOC family protein [Rhodococcus sp. NBC_00297]